MSDDSATESGTDKFAKPAPRYTSYPPVPYFGPYDSPERYLGLIQASNRRGASGISLYVHLPFCPHRCLFCGCNTEIGASASLVKRYVHALRTEIGRLLPLLDRTRKVTQVHFGGGTPNAVPIAFLEEIMMALRAGPAWDPGAEIAIECDPALLVPGKLEDLRALGFNRLSLGIQDFDPRVLAAVERKAPKLSARELVAQARALGFSGINLDLIYGLPFQTRVSFEETLDRAILSDPDRISVFAYAHVPWVKGHQGILEKFPMPGAPERMRMALDARRFLLAADYVPIGMDHYVKPSDSLARAKEAGRLHRNFQGYCSKEHTGQVYAFGASAITQLEGGYGQNRKDTARYIDAVAEGGFPLERVYYMTTEDILAREAIETLMCYGRVDLGALAGSVLDAGVHDAYLQGCRARLEEYAGEAWLHWDGFRLEVAEAGWPLVRHIAAALDPRTGAPESAARFSRGV